MRVASLALLPVIAAVPVQVLLELRGKSQLGVLVTSREGMSRGAPLSCVVPPGCSADMWV